MAQFINFPVVNGFVGGGAAAPQLDGDNLVQIAQISTFTIATANAGAGTSQTDITFNLAGLPYSAGFLGKEFLLFQILRDDFISGLVRSC